MNKKLIIAIIVVISTLAGICTYKFTSLSIKGSIIAPLAGLITCILAYGIIKGTK